MAKQITDRCPHAKNCWLNDAYVFCKTSGCKEPLVPKESKPEIIRRVVKENMERLAEMSPDGKCDSVLIMANESDMAEIKKAVEIQGELF